VEWSPDGKYISYISDISGEDEIYIVEQDGNSPPVQLTFNSDTYKYNPIWSPDGKRLLWSDKKLRLNYLDIDSKEVTVVDQVKGWEIRSYNWSPDNNWITYSVPSNKEVSKIWIYNVESGEKQVVTDDWYDCSSPVFSDDGKYLFFVSNRDFNPIYSWVEWNHAYRDMSKIYMITLRKDIPSPFEPENDEVKVKEEEADEKKEEKKDGEEEDEGIKIDFDGIKGRIIGLPVSAGFYFNLTSVDNSLYYANGSASKPTALKLFDFGSKKETELGPYGSFLVSFDKKKMFISSRGK
jgi:tricorn protease